MVEGFFRFDGTRYVPLVRTETSAGVLTLKDYIETVALPRTFAATYDVGPGKRFATITAACQAANLDNQRVLNRGDQGAPWLRRRIRVWPQSGGYKQETFPLPLPTNVLLVGMGSEREDVRIWDDRGADRSPGQPVTPWTGPDAPSANIVSTGAGSATLSNIWLDHDHPDPKFHALRDAGIGGLIGFQGYQRRTVILNNVRLTSHPQGKAGKCAVDATPTAVDWVAYKSVFDAAGTPQALNFILNYGKEPQGPSRYLFYDCSVVAGHDWYADNTLPNNGYQADGTPGAVVPFGSVDWGTAAGDELWWIQGPNSVWDTQVGPKYSSPPEANFSVLKNKGPVLSNARYHVDPTIPGSHPDGTAAAAIRGTPTLHIDPMQPITQYGGVFDRVMPERFPMDVIDGAAKAERDFYGPHPNSVTRRRPLKRTTAATSRTLPAGRIYFVPTPTLSTTAMVATVKMDVTGDGSGIAGVAVSNPYTGIPYVTAGFGRVMSSAQPLTGAGVKSWQVDNVPVFPGHKLWLVYAGSSAATAPTGVVTSGLKVFYADGYTGGNLATNITLTELPVGEPYPLAEGVNIF